MDLKATDEIVGNPNRPKTRIVNGYTPPAPEPPPHNLGVIAPISGRVGGKWGAE